VNGRIKWRNNKNILGTYLALSEEQDVLVMAFLEHAWKISSEVGGRLWAFQASNGKALWNRKVGYYNPPVLVGGDLYAYPFKYDLLTGAPREEVNLVTGELEAWEIRGKTFGCGPLTGSRGALFNRSGTLSYVDLGNYQGRLESYGGIRPGCWIAALPVGGLVLMPDDTSNCTCSYLNQASIALIHRPVRPPVVHPDGAIFWDRIVVEMRSFEGYEIRYTTDGSEPDGDSLLYTEPFELRETTDIRAAVFEGAKKIDTLDAKRFVKTQPMPPLPNVHLSDLRPVRAVGGLSDKGVDHFFAENEVGFDRQFDDRPLALGGERFEKGLSALTLSEFVYDLKPEYERFVARVGLGEPGAEVVGGPDTYRTDVLPGWATIKILIDGVPVHESPRLKPDQPPWNVDLQLPEGASQIMLYALFDQAGGKEHWDRAVVVVNWANAGFLTNGP
jgi:hypothetical protein